MSLFRRIREEMVENETTKWVCAMTFMFGLGLLVMLWGLAVFLFLVLAAVTSPVWGPIYLLVKWLRKKASGTP